MALEQFEKDMAIIAALDDEPNDVGGLSAAELKAKFDEGGEALKEYLNGTLLPALEAAGVLNIVPNTRTVNGHALSEDISLDADDVGAMPVDGSGVMTGPIRWNGTDGPISISPDGNNIIISTTNGYLQLNVADFRVGIANISVVKGVLIEAQTDVKTPSLTGANFAPIAVNDHLDMLNARRVINLPAPINDGDAIPKSYAAAGLSTRLSLGGGDMSGPINMGGFKITNLAEPVDSYDAARNVDISRYAVAKTTLGQRLYGTNSSGAATTFTWEDGASNASTFVRRTALGTIKTAAPLADNDAVNKQYADTGLNGKLPLDGSGTMTGNLVMGGKKVTALGTPTSDTDASPKKYVDDALALKADKQYVDDNTALLATNLITNGDFHAGTEGWERTVSDASIAAVDKELVLTLITPTANAGVYRSIGAIVGHKYYVRAMFYPKYSRLITINAGGVSVSNPNPIANEWNTLTGVVTATSTGSIIVYHNVAASYVSGDTYKIKDVLAIDLTATFGAGNEPTDEEMDAILSYYPNSWFDGTVNIAQSSKMLPYLLSAIRAKADKAQEAWIVPTLVNGATGTFRYRKNSFGRVETSGTLTQASIASNATTTIAGYRPVANINLAVPCTDGTTVGVQLRSTGALYLLSGAAGKTLDFSGVSTSLE